jgi:hypothetical protein
MADPILDEIWRVREELIKKHGGLDGYFAYIQKLDRARRRREQRQKSKKPPPQRVKTSD